MKKVYIGMVGLLVSSALGVRGGDFPSLREYQVPYPTKEKKVTVPLTFSLTWKSYIKGLSTDQIQTLIYLLHDKINSSTGRALKQYKKMQEFSQDTLSRYEWLAGQ